MASLGLPLVCVVVGGAGYLSTLLDTQMQLKDKVGTTLSKRIRQCWLYR